MVAAVLPFKYTNYSIRRFETIDIIKIIAEDLNIHNWKVLIFNIIGKNLCVCVWSESEILIKSLLLFVLPSVIHIQSQLVWWWDREGVTTMSPHRLWAINFCWSLPWPLAPNYHLWYYVLLIGVNNLVEQMFWIGSFQFTYGCGNNMYFSVKLASQDQPMEFCDMKFRMIIPCLRSMGKTGQIWMTKLSNEMTENMEISTIRPARFYLFFCARCVVWVSFHSDQWHCYGNEYWFFLFVFCFTLASK